MVEPLVLVEWVVLGVAVFAALGWVVGYVMYRFSKNRRKDMKTTLLGVVMPDWNDHHESSE